MPDIPPVCGPDHWQEVIQGTDGGEPNTKPFVKITDWSILPTSDGGKTLCGIPLDHPNHIAGHSVSNTRLIRTSPIIDMNLEEGWVETQNTNYILMGQEENLYR